MKPESAIDADAMPDPHMADFDHLKGIISMNTTSQPKLLVLCVVLLALSGCAGHSHYAGWEARDIKALSPSDIEGMRAGRGMSLALAAELNGYPGPLHVLELESKLELTPEQRTATQDLFRRMKTAAIAAGEDVVSSERELDRLFATKRANAPQLTAALDRVAQAQARLRGTHLQAHLEQVRILTPAQVAKYNSLRGYGQRMAQHSTSSDLQAAVFQPSDRLPAATTVTPSPTHVNRP